MTPLWRHPEPDDRPSTAEMVGAVVLVVVALFVLWFASIITQPIP